MDNDSIANLGYLIAAVLFIFGLKGLTHPRTAVRGNQMGAAAMLLGVITVLWHQETVHWEFIFIGLLIGGVIGQTLAKKIAMTDMPQLVAIFNGLGGGASVFIVSVTLIIEEPDDFVVIGAMAASALIGTVTFWGSLVAFAKLQGLVKKNLEFPGQMVMNVILVLGVLVASGMFIYLEEDAIWFMALVVVATLLGLFLVSPIGGADMPVVISLLNSYSGLAACSTGFVLNNNVLIIGGALVGAAGLILTKIMCKAMNRSLTNVILGKFEGSGESASADEVYAGKVKSTSPEEVAMLLETATRVVVVPGYGMAVAQAQHVVRDMANLLEERGIDVEYGIHPVAGRMPGHMNVLLAEADIPYDKLKNDTEINSEIEQVDVVLVIGANDVVNPLARDDPNSAIAGMPIINVDLARTIVVIKRSLSPGFAGIPNPLFAKDNCLMMFGDGKAALLDLVAALKDSA